MTSVRDFILHLRLNYNFLILSASFLLGALYVSRIGDTGTFILLFLLVYIFLFGGANAYNSYFDKDKGPIGGLEHPPKMTKWMYFAAWAVQIVGLAVSFIFHLPLFSFLFFISLVSFWLYSSPVFKFKAKPLLSFLVIGAGTVFSTTLMGYIAAGGDSISLSLTFGAIGATLIVLSMYPFSQAYQVEEDKERGYDTFAVRYGVRGIKINYLVLFLPGVLLMAYSFVSNMALAAAVLIVGLLAYVFNWQVVKTITGNQREYKKIMRAKYFSGATFTLMMVLLLALF
jgi:4-hydroxybenzoate polyprenyltransferase